MPLNFDWLDKNEQENKGTAGTAVSPYSLNGIKAAYKPYEAQIEKVTAEVDRAVINDDDQFNKIVDTVGFSRRLIKELVKVREGFTEKPYRYYKDCLSLQNILKNKLEALINSAQKKANEYGAKKRQAEMEAARKEKEAQDKLQKELDAAAKKAGAETVTLPPVAPAIVKPPPVRTEAASAKIEPEWTYKVVNLSKVPRKYMVLSDQEVKKAIKAGIRKIAGLEIYEEVKTKIRSR